MVQADPEGFIRSLDADTGPDADNPRACGVALLLCMLRKGSSHVAEAMLSYVTHLQVCLRSTCPEYRPSGAMNISLSCLYLIGFLKRTCNNRANAVIQMLQELPVLCICCDFSCAEC